MTWVVFLPLFTVMQWGTQCDLTAEAHLILYSEGWLLLFRFLSVCWFIYTVLFFYFSWSFFLPSTFRNPTQGEMSNLMVFFYGLAWQVLNVFCLMIWHLSCTLKKKKKKKCKLVFAGLGWSLSLAWVVPTFPQNISHLDQPNDAGRPDRGRNFAKNQLKSASFSLPSLLVLEYLD